MNVILIGMPGAGKSTVGVILAKRLGLDFLDSDILLQARQGRRLQEIIDQDGLAVFLALEEDLLANLQLQKMVLATGGSAVYSEPGMTALRRQGRTVFLDVPLPELERRVRDMDTRGMVIDPGESFADLHRRRLLLYRRYADLIVRDDGRSAEETAAEVARLLSTGEDDR